MRSLVDWFSIIGDSTNAIAVYDDATLDIVPHYLVEYQIDTFLNGEFTAMFLMSCNGSYTLDRFRHGRVDILNMLNNYFAFRLIGYTATSGIEFIRAENQFVIMEYTAKQVIQNKKFRYNMYSLIKFDSGKTLLDELLE